MKPQAAVAPPAPWGGQPYSIKRHGTTLASRDSEPVQTPGCIQAHGALLVLLDLNTPRDDGRLALCEIRRDETLRRLPVVVLSASANPRDLQFCYAHGANAYHVKPVEHQLHLQVLEQVFAYWFSSAVLPD